MRIILVVVPALLFAGEAAAQKAAPDPRETGAKVPPVEYRSALEGYRPYAESELRDWRKSNEEVGAGGHAGDKPGQGPGAHTSKPQPGKPATSGHEGHK